MPQGPASAADGQMPQGLAHSRWDRRRLVAILAATLAVLLVGLTLLARHWPFSRQRVIADLQEDFHGTVTFSRFHITVFPHPGCVAEGATLVRSGRPPGRPRFAFAHTVAISS